MKKVLWFTGLLLLGLVLTGCSSGSGKKATEEFNKLMDDYIVKQDNLWLKQSEWPSGEFEEVLQHAREILDSAEYKEWLEASEKIESYELPNKTEEDKKLQDAKQVVVDCNEVQTKYFTSLAKATSADDFGNILDELNPSLKEVLNKLNKVTKNFQSSHTK